MTRGAVRDGTVLLRCKSAHFAMDMKTDNVLSLPADTAQALRVKRRPHSQPKPARMTCCS